MVSLFRAVPDLAEIDASAFDDLPEVLSNFEEKALRGGRRIARSVFERPRPPV
jgi:hypothetical protein